MRANASPPIYTCALFNFLLLLLLSVGCDSARDANSILQQQNLTDSSAMFTADGNWQGTWADYSWLASRDDASELHKNFRAPSVHYLNESGNVVGLELTQCNYESSKIGTAPMTWQNASTTANETTLDVLGDDIFVFSPLSIGWGLTVEKRGEQHYSFNDFTVRNGREIVKVADEFLFNSSWNVSAPGFVPQNALSGCAGFGWDIDEDTGNIELDAFAAQLPFISDSGEQAEISMSIFFQGSEKLEERTYRNTTTDEPRISLDRVVVKLTPGSRQVYGVNDVHLNVLKIDDNSIKLQITGELRGGTPFNAEGSIFLNTDFWIPQ